jgi:hypothetical protein
MEEGAKMKTMRISKSGPASLSIALTMGIGLILTDTSSLAHDPARLQSAVHLQFESVEGKAWVAEFKDGVEQEGWVPFASAFGTGGAAVATDPEPNPISRFYRVRTSAEVASVGAAAFPSSGSGIETVPGSIAGDPPPPAPPEPVTEISPVTGPVIVNLPGAIREGEGVPVPQPVTQLIPIRSVIVTYPGTITGLTMEGDLQPVGGTTPATEPVVVVLPGAITGGIVTPTAPAPVTQVTSGQDPASR